VDDATSPHAGPIGSAFYAHPRFLHQRQWRDWWTVLHPPYTMLHLSLVIIGACLAGPVNAVHLVATLVAFFLALGLGAHSLDELKGRPLGTNIPTAQLVVAASLGLGGAVALGVAGMFLVSPFLAVFIAVGALIAVAYNLELWGGRLHTRLVLILGWGGFPVLTAYFAQHASLSIASIFAAMFGVLITLIQQQLSTPARELRRRTSSVDGRILRADGTSTSLDRDVILLPLEGALKTLCWSGVAIAAALLCVRFIA